MNKQVNVIYHATRYKKELGALHTMTHARNDNLVRIAIHGILSGIRTSEQIAEDLREAGGEPQLSESECSRAVQTAARWIENGGRTARPFARPVSSEERDWVRLMIERGCGTTADAIQDASPHLQPYDQYGERVLTIPRRAEMNQDATFVSHIQAILSLEPERGDSLLDQFWIAHDQAHGQLMTAFDLINCTATVENGLRPVPNFFIPNALTGKMAATKDGRQSLRCDAAVVVPKVMVVEFDNLTMEDQLAFWGGVLSTGTLKVVSLVHSGNKSIHALVEVEGEYSLFKERILRLCCSSPDPRFRCDPAVLHPSALTRLAGAWRGDTGRYQELLFARCL